MIARRSSRIIAWLSLVLLVVPLVACGGEDDSDADAPTPAASPTAAAPSPTTPSAATASPAGPSPTSSGADQLPPLVLLALQTAAEDAGVPVEQVELVEWTTTEWNDSSLGCPQPGEFYAQVITPGYIVTVRVAGEEREYHTDSSNRVVTC